MNLLILIYLNWLGPWKVRREIFHRLLVTYRDEMRYMLIDWPWGALRNRCVALFSEGYLIWNVEAKMSRVKVNIDL